jgi:hypothetical protein
VGDYGLALDRHAVKRVAAAAAIALAAISIGQLPDL